MQYFIYQLVDPRDGLPHYIGCTQSLEQRIQWYRPHSNSMRKWFKELETFRLTAIVQIVETIEGDEQQAHEREAYWIKLLSSQNMPLVNKQNVVRRKQQTFYLPFDLARWLRFHAIEQEKDMSELVTEVLQMYRDLHS